MPLYDFRCEACSNSFEKLVRASTAEASIACPDCGSAHIRRMPSVFGVGRSSAASALPVAAGPAPA